MEVLSTLVLAEAEITRAAEARGSHHRAHLGAVESCFPIGMRKSVLSVEVNV